MMKSNRSTQQSIQYHTATPDVNLRTGIQSKTTVLALAMTELISHMCTVNWL